jgi:hypothetical protein
MTAAGSAITAAWINSDSAILTICGTPPPPLPHVAGVGAKMLWESSYSPRQLHDALTASATAGMVTYSQASGHNAQPLLQSDCEGSKTQLHPLASE